MLLATAANLVKCLPAQNRQLPSMLDNDALAQLKQAKADIRQQDKRFQGVVSGSQNTFGFVRSDDGQQFFLPPPEMQKTFPEDRIEFQVRTDDKGREFAAVEKLISSELKSFCGKCVQRGKAWFVEMDVPRLNRKLFLPPPQRKGVQPGDWLQCRISRHPVREGKGQAAVTKNLGPDSAADFPSRYSAVNFQLHSAAEAPVLPDLPPLLEQRKDYRDTPFASIDPPSSRDIDDALYAQPQGQGWKLLVAIADPASIIPLNDKCATSALACGATAYLPHMQLPMFPPALSESLLSLKAGEERLALVCEMQISPSGEVTGFQLEAAAIRNRAELNYGELNTSIAQKQFPTRVDEATRASLEALYDATSKMREWRSVHQLLSVDRPEYSINLDEQGRASGFSRVEKGAAQQLVEECMLAVNQAAAKKLAPFGGIFSAHGGFRSEKLGNAATVLKEAGFSDFSKAGELNQLPVYRRAIQFLQQSGEHAHTRNLLSRFLQRAYLSAEPQPHLGLGIDCYLGFTSPLRRYADFYNHHQMRKLLAEQEAMGLDEKCVLNLEQQLGRIKSASYWAEQWLRCEYLQRQSATELQGAVIQANPYGVVVRLEETGIEGIIEKRVLPDKAKFDPAQLRFSEGETSLGLGDEVTVSLKSVQRDQRKILLDWRVPPRAAKAEPA